MTTFTEEALGLSPGWNTVSSLFESLESLNRSQISVLVQHILNEWDIQSSVYKIPGFFLKTFPERQQRSRQIILQHHTMTKIIHYNGVLTDSRHGTAFAREDENGKCPRCGSLVPKDEVSAKDTQPTSTESSTSASSKPVPVPVHASNKISTAKPPPLLTKLTDKWKGQHQDLVDPGLYRTYEVWELTDKELSSVMNKFWDLLVIFGTYHVEKFQSSPTSEYSKPSSPFPKREKPYSHDKEARLRKKLVLLLDITTMDIEDMQARAANQVETVAAIRVRLGHPPNTSNFNSYFMTHSRTSEIKDGEGGEDGEVGEASQGSEDVNFSKDEDYSGDGEDYEDYEGRSDCRTEDSVEEVGGEEDGQEEDGQEEDGQEEDSEEKDTGGVDWCLDAEYNGDDEEDEDRLDSEVEDSEDSEGKESTVSEEGSKDEDRSDVFNSDPDVNNNMHASGYELDSEPREETGTSPDEAEASSDLSETESHADQVPSDASDYDPQYEDEHVWVSDYDEECSCKHCRYKREYFEKLARAYEDDDLEEE
ncbi:uncharacterized protein PAC_14171 [Phialocephala subalpina]|uniref:Uncharacterized protein n=1 Tax=Phialocephala subalpina TaxID=576137 RepID=A0A1L7XGV2_9HELO|nr:uncharacterized protein PAC_14171 [Phialocephala subalpina]